jgi:hypothetical protein
MIWYLLEQLGRVAEPRSSSHLSRQVQSGLQVHKDLPLRPQFQQAISLDDCGHVFPLEEIKFQWFLFKKWF